MPKILITGVTGFLGSHLARALRARGARILGTSRGPASPEGGDHLPLDLAALAALDRALLAAPDLVIHAGAISRLDQCEQDPELARRVNVLASERLAQLAAQSGCGFVLVSTDQVFDGSRGAYREEDEPRPINVYGRTKREAEERVQRMHPRALVLRLPLLYGPSPTGDRGASDAVLAALRRGDSPRLFADEIRSPADVREIAAAIAELVGRSASGLLHLGGPEPMSRHELGVLVARNAGFDPARLIAGRASDHGGPPRPRDVSLNSERAMALLEKPLRSPRVVLPASS